MVAVINRVIWGCERDYISDSIPKFANLHIKKFPHYESFKNKSVSAYYSQFSP